MPRAAGDAGRENGRGGWARQSRSCGWPSEGQLQQHSEDGDQTGEGERRG